MAKITVYVEHNAEGGHNIAHHLGNFVHELEKTGHVVTHSIVSAADKVGEVATDAGKDAAHVAGTVAVAGLGAFQGVD